MKKADINIEGNDEAEEVEGKDGNGTETLGAEEIKEKSKIVEEKEANKKEGKYRVRTPFFQKRRYEEGELSDFTKKEAEELIKEELIEEV